MVAVGNPLSFKLQSGTFVSLSENEMRKFFEFETLKHEPDEQYKDLFSIKSMSFKFSKTRIIVPGDI